MKVKRLKITNILLALNVLVLFLIVGYYLIRGIKYYIKENKKTSDDTVKLVDAVLKKQSYMDLTQGLVYDEKDKVYRYKGDVKDNYIQYSGILFRIVSVDNENNVKAVSEKNVTIMYSGLEKGYSNSYINKWLNINNDIKNSGIFENVLVNSEEYLSNTYSCSDVVDDIKNITCEKYSNDTKLSILSLYDYASASGKESYLNNGETFYLSTLNSDNEDYYVNQDGDVGLNKITTKTYGVRPVITINTNTILLSGKGTKSDPYIIEEHETKTLGDLYVGDILTFSNNNYKVISKNSDSIKVASTDVLKENDKEVKKDFSGLTSKYTTKTNIGEYLNNSFYNSLENKEYIVKSSWYVGTQTLENLDYLNIYNIKTNAYIGMLTLSDLYVQDVKNVFTISRGIEADAIINVINSDGYVYGDFISSKYMIRPAFNLNSKVTIESGDGTEENPYILGGLDEEKEEN